MVVHNQHVEPWKVTIVDTGLNTLTGGRLKRIKKYIDDETFLMTYGDGICDVNLNELVKFHQAHGKLATLTAVQPDGRFGVMDIDGDYVSSFREKNKGDVGWINGGYMVLEPEVLDYISGDMTAFEGEPMERLARESQLVLYKHDGFWQCMDTLRDKNKLEELWESDNAAWRIWS